MANQKPKKTTKKSTTKPGTKKEATVVAPAVQTASANEPSLKGFFARKCDKNENVLTIFKSPRIWGALLGELVGTMFFMMLMLTLGVQPLYFVLAMVGVYVAIFYERWQQTGVGRRCVAGCGSRLRKSVAGYVGGLCDA